MAVMLLVAFLFQGTWALAGTTGSLSGQVTDAAGAPISGAAVKVVSASQSASASTDASGHFVFLSLTPDTYSVSIEKDQYNPVSYAGVTVFADQQQTLSFRMEKVMKTIARVTSTAAGALVKAGTTSDVYSVNSATASKVTGLGGGGSLDQAYSALATVPGAYVPVGGSGWYQNVYIRGGDYDQVGYEVDGVPVNRAFDNYPSNTASALGQQEVQLYTGASPSNAEGQGLSGYINQVIKTGTYPGFVSSDLGVGAPTFYHKANVEAGGATPDRRFSYYVGLGGYNQAYRTFDQQNGASISNLWGTPAGPACPGTAPAGVTLPGCYSQGGQYEGSATCDNTGVGCWYVLSPYSWYAQNLISDRENVVNFHFAIPHRNGDGRDDLQLLWQGSDLKTFYDSGAQSFGPPGYQNVANGGPFTYPSSIVYSGPVNSTIAASGATPTSFAPAIQYCFPSAPQVAACGGNIASNFSDNVDNAVGILKLQYQKNMGSDAYLRVYGYTVYSNWFNYGPISASLCCTGIPVDYELFTHSRGVSATFADQMNSKNLIQLQGSYTDATSTRMNNSTWGAGSGVIMANLVNASNPMNGVCYDLGGAPRNCDQKSSTGGYLTPGSLFKAQLPGGALPAAPGTCGTGACEWYVSDTGYYGSYNTVQPRFYSTSLTDEWDPSDRLHLNLGVRLDSYQYVPSNTSGGAYDFWSSAFSNSYCVDSTVLGAVPQEKANPAAACSTLGANFVPVTWNGTSQTQTYTVFQPRIAATYTVNPQNVLRASWGKYDQAPNAAFQQYGNLNNNLPDRDKNFYILGFDSPSHEIRPEISYNADFSWEHQVKGTDMSFKLTPFYRKTKDQIQQFYLDLRTNFVSGVNVGSQTSDGLEFQFQKGDFSRNGFAALLSYAYTNAYVTYSPAANGTTPITTIDQQIASYNAFTSACNGGSNSNKQYGQNVCGNAGKGQTAFPCYDPTSNVGLNTCTAADVANPYWNAPAQGLYDPAGKYVPLDLFAGPAPGAGDYRSFVRPHVATLVLNYKHDKFSVTPGFQFSAGGRYGYPIATMGFDPSSCTGTLGAVSGDPRYPYGGNGSSADATTCATQAIAIPNPATNKFDGVGAFTLPNHLTMQMQLAYDVSPRLSVVGTLTNIFDTCWGGTKGAWTSPVGIRSSAICAYGGGYSGVGYNPIGNNYNPGMAIQPFQQYSYAPAFSSLPFNAYVDFKFRI